MKQIQYTSHDGKQLALFTWDNVTAPKAVVKICHGMAEHSARYDDFANYLNSQGYLVVSNDHRAHGLTTTADSLGYDEGDIFTNNALDQIHIVDSLVKQYNLPVVLFGHSYGSFLTQYVMQHNCLANAYVLSGSNHMSGLVVSFGAIVASSMCRNKGGRYPAKFIADMSFGAYEKKIPGKNNWLSRDSEQVAKYNDDALCGYVCSANFYRTFMNGVKGLYSKQNYGEIDTSKPLLIISGENDPVGEYGKGVNKLHKFYQNKVGVADLTLQLYKEGRHELLNETSNAEVYAFISQWLDGAVATKGE